jgi:HAD superfamily hydrolase (TIGR01484 family)
MPEALENLPAEVAKGLRGVFCDIDDTLTWRGELVPEAYAALAALRASGLRVIPVTGRPAGWADHIARMWPVDGVVGENGGLWFYRTEAGFSRGYIQSATERAANRARLDALGGEILRAVPGCALASDQRYRELDLAVDWCEDVPRLDDAAIDAIVASFTAIGATAKVSSIHVNGWFGAFDKLTGARRLVSERWGESLTEDAGAWLYLGDSGNDEPMFEFFPNTIGVANVVEFLPRMTHHPRWICQENGGHGFAEAARHVLSLR